MVHSRKCLRLPNLHFSLWICLSQEMIGHFTTVGFYHIAHLNLTTYYFPGKTYCNCQWRQAQGQHLQPQQQLLWVSRELCWYHQKGIRASSPSSSRLSLATLQVALFCISHVWKHSKHTLRTPGHDELEAEMHLCIGSQSSAYIFRWSSFLHQGQGRPGHRYFRGQQFLM